VTLDTDQAGTIDAMAPKRPARYKSLREAIVREMDLQEINSTDLSRLSSVDRTLIHRYTSGEIDTTSEKIDAMLTALRIEIRPHMDH